MGIMYSDEIGKMMASRVGAGEEWSGEGTLASPWPGNLMILTKRYT